jgi:hypothetical protein
MTNQKELLNSLSNMSGNSLAIGKEFVSETISHVGVRGMRWGVRRSRSAKYAAKAERKAERKNIEGKANVKTMTDAEMKTIINRIKLEQEYKKLTTKPTKLDAGKKIAGKILVTAVTTGGSKIVESYLGPIVQKAMLDKANTKKLVSLPNSKAILPKGSPLPPPPRMPPRPNI